MQLALSHALITTDNTHVRARASADTRTIEANGPDWRYTHATPWTRGTYFTTGIVRSRGTTTSNQIFLLHYFGFWMLVFYFFFYSRLITDLVIFVAAVPLAMGSHHIVWYVCYNSCLKIQISFTYLILRLNLRDRTGTAIGRFQRDLIQKTCKCIPCDLKLNILFI